MIIGRAISPMFGHDQSRLLTADGKDSIQQQEKKLSDPGATRTHSL